MTVALASLTRCATVRSSVIVQTERFCLLYGNQWTASCLAGTAAVAVAPDMQALLERSAHRATVCSTMNAQRCMRSQVVCSASRGSDDVHCQSRRQVLQGTGFVTCVALTQLSYACTVYAEEAAVDALSTSSSSTSSMGSAVAAAGSSQGGQRVGSLLQHAAVYAKYRTGALPAECGAACTSSCISPQAPCGRL